MKLSKLGIKTLPLSRRYGNDY